MNTKLLAALGISLVLTLALETAFFLLTGKRNRKDMLLVVLVNVLTNPIVILLYWLAVLYANWSPVIVAALLELFAVLAEGFCYKKYGQAFRRPYLFSAAANAFSYGIGVLLQRFI